MLHPRAAALTLAHPWLPLARMVAAPASRRYFAGWFTEADIHVLSPPALERRASKVPGSREALLLSPLHEYSHLVIGANNPDLPPPFSPAAFRRYVRWAWLCEGGAVWLSGQTPYLRAAIVRRLREGGRPEFPPSARDAMLLGGTIFSMLEREAGPAPRPRSPRARSRTAARAGCWPRRSTASSRASSATGAPSSTRYRPLLTPRTPPRAALVLSAEQARGPARAMSIVDDVARRPLGHARGGRRELHAEPPATPARADRLQRPRRATSAAVASPASIAMTANSSPP